MLKAFEITTPLPPRGSATALREQLIEHLLRTRPGVGERFLSDHELTRIAGLSRPTVRRALDDLEREGWIERRPGIGTFIGPRAAITLSFQQSGGDGNGNPAKRTVRLALMIHMLGDLGHDWYTGGVIAGIDRAAEETAVSLQLLGAHDGDVKTVSRRLLQNRPDVLAFAAPPLRNTVLLGEARRLDIPCIGTGTLLVNLGVPTVCEDGEAAAAQAVKHLVDHGHRRIGLVAPSFALPWVFQRRAGFMRGLADAGLEPDEGMVLWVNGHNDAERTDMLQRFLDKRKPTALLFTTWVLVERLAPLVRSGKLRIPQDLSVITFDQHPSVPIWLGDIRPTTLTMPLNEMGRRLAHMAHDAARGKTLEMTTTLPCELIEGDSVTYRSAGAMHAT